MFNQDPKGVRLKLIMQEDRDLTYRVQFLELPGAIRHRKVCAGMAADAVGAVIVFDVTRRHTYESCKQWVAEVAQSQPALRVMLVGSKADINQGREVAMWEAAEFARQSDWLYCETSVQQPATVQQAITSLLATIADSIPQYPDANQLMDRNIRIGRQLLDDPKYLLKFYHT